MWFSNGAGVWLLGLSVGGCVGCRESVGWGSHAREVLFRSAVQYADWVRSYGRHHGLAEHSATQLSLATCWEGGGPFRSAVQHAAWVWRRPGCVACVTGWEFVLVGA